MDDYYANRLRNEHNIPVRKIFTLKTAKILAGIVKYHDEELNDFIGYLKLLIKPEGESGFMEAIKKLKEERLKRKKQYEVIRSAREELTSRTG